MSDLQKTMLKGRMPPKSPRMSPASRRKDYTPLPWKKFFERHFDVTTENGVFRLYVTPEPDGFDRLRILAMHGGGYSGLTWAPFAEEITAMIRCQVIAMDMRGHGETQAINPEDMSTDTLVKDVELVIKAVFPETMPPLLLVGHSMGGAIAVRVAELESLRPYMQGLAVIDVVEGTAMDSLASMQNFLRSRPSHFRSIEHAIEWCVRSGQVRNVDSARVSMPSQIVNVESGLLAINELDNYVPDETPQPTPQPTPTRHPALPDRIIEEEEDDEIQCIIEHPPAEGPPIPHKPLLVPHLSIEIADEPENTESGQASEQPSASQQFLHPDIKIDIQEQAADESAEPEAKKVAVEVEFINECKDLVAGPSEQAQAGPSRRSPDPDSSDSLMRRPTVGDGIRLSTSDGNSFNRYSWRIELSRTEPYWAGWFSGLSTAFLRVKIPRLLLLASINGLDKDLMVGQMQGKFQLHVMPGCGHAVHEDNPNEVARAVASFALRYKLTEATSESEEINLTGRPGC